MKQYDSNSHYINLKFDCCFATTFYINLKIMIDKLIKEFPRAFVISNLVFVVLLVFKLAAVSAVTVAVTTPVVSPYTVFICVNVVVSLIVTAQFAAVVNVAPVLFTISSACDIVAVEIVVTFVKLIALELASFTDLI